jgi:hypothetical protein
MSEKIKESEQVQIDENVLLTFLQRTKDGEYAEVEKSSFPYCRITVQREEIYDDEEEYYYSTR